uniref:Uncharacterized protein n=1 Tax=Anopheles maculatus TaxID=74869 RepID=A0A182SPR6_9DIPT
MRLVFGAAPAEKFCGFYVIAESGRPTGTQRNIGGNHKHSRSFFTVFFALVLAVATVAGQRFGFPHTAQFGLASLTGDFGGPTAFGGQDLSGPVVFPPAPADAPVESSGVIVGASGYGFVPPNTPQSKTE